MRKFYFNKSVIFFGFIFIFLISDSLAIINLASIKSNIRKRRYIYYTTCAAVGSVIVGLLGYKTYNRFNAQQFEKLGEDANGDANVPHVVIDMPPEEGTDNTTTGGTKGFQAAICGMLKKKR